MALVYPGASYRQLRGKSRTLLNPLIINVHTMVGTQAGTESWFSGSGRAYSHFGVAGNGEVRQWQDLRYRAASDLYGNPFSISIETEDMGRYFPKWGGSDVPNFTHAQRQAMIRLLSWLTTRFNINRVLLSNSCQRHGVSYHRLGVDPYRRSGCTKYSNAFGKVCPGDRKIHDLKTNIIPALRGGVQVIEEKDEFLMALSDKQQKQLFDHIVGNGRLKEVTLNTRELKGKPSGYFATREQYPGYVYYVFADHSGRIKMRVGDPLHEWLKDLHALGGANVRAHELKRVVIDRIPVVSEPPSDDSGN